VFDPLDGTVNYAHGLPIFCSSLALEVHGRAEVGAVFDPTRQELFTTERGQGAFLNGQPLSVSTADTLIDGMLVTGFPYDVHQRAADLLEVFAAFLGRARAVRRLGSAALDLCYVAAGRFEAFWEQTLKPWDVAAGALIVEEAGGRISGMDGTPFDPAAAHLIASNGLIHEQMLEVIRDTRDKRSRMRTD
jgi:myo-inositol-1(or 4)-monophosphatase